jgi:hypothetical protein
MAAEVKSKLATCDKVITFSRRMELVLFEHFVKRCIHLFMAETGLDIYTNQMQTAMKTS